MWLPLVHHKFEPGLNVKWYSQDVLVILLAAAIAGYCLSLILPQSDNRGMQFTEVVVTGVFVLLASTAASSEARARVSDWLVRQQQRKAK